MTKVVSIFFAVLYATFLPKTIAQQLHKTVVPQISAHRGASRVAPENTMASFSKAIEAGTNFIEIDVRTTADGQQVIVHDRSLKRTTGMNATVDKTDYSTIESLSAGSWFGNSFSGEKVPTLEQVCKLVNSVNKGRDNAVMLYVDCKSINAAKVVRSLEKYELLESAVFYGDIQTLKEIKGLFTKARVMPAFSSIKEADDVIQDVRPYAFDVPFEKLDVQTVSYIRSKNIKVFSDLLGENDNPVAYRKAIEYGVDVIQTDDIEGVLRSYREYENRKK